MNLKQTKTADIAMKTTIVKMTCGVLALYFICYLVLSFRGAYSTKLYITRHRYAATGLGMPTSLIWEPLMVKSTPFEMNSLGYLFAPCVYLDRRIWHEEIDAFSFFDSNQQGLPP